MLFPTSYLPSIKSIKSTSTDKLQSSLDYLWIIYNPPIRGGSLRRSKQPNSPQPDLKSDTKFERAYALKWLTALIAQQSALDDASSPNVDRLVQNAASLLATCAGKASAGIIDRTFVFDTGARSTDEDDPDDHSSSSFESLSRTTITVEIKDDPLDNQDYRSVGAQTWGSACVMADMIAQDPQSFGIPSSSHGANTLLSFRCLELGAGTGLVSLTVAKLLEPTALLLDDSTSVQVEVVPSDYYPAVLANLEKNIRANFNASSPVHIHPIPLDWAVFAESDPASDLAVLKNRFNAIYGADIVYEAQHAQWIKGCLRKLLQKPDNVNEQNPAFHLIIPLRKTHTVESSTIEQVFETRVESQNTVGDLVIKHKEMIICESDTESAEEIEYVYYRIGWEI